MPSDGKFAFRVLVGGRPLPEYSCNGENYIESNLWTPYSYQQEISEIVNGEKEAQKFPVTPYQLVLRLGSDCDTSAFFIYVDGILVTKTLLGKGETKVIQGFQDRTGLKEFLFALPRFAKDEKDRIEKSRSSEIGKIEIVRKVGRFVREEYRPTAEIKFSQATKKDAFTVTGGNYTMSTTRKGRHLSRTRPYEVKLKKMWRMDASVGSLSVQYRMGHCLEEMGVRLQDIDWTKCNNRRVHRTASDSSSENSIIDDDANNTNEQQLVNDQHYHYLLTTNIDDIKKDIDDENDGLLEMQTTS